MSTPIERIDIEERAMERAEELAQKRYHQEFDSLTPPQQMDLFMEAEQQEREKLNEAAELAGELAWERENIPDNVGDLEKVR